MSTEETSTEETSTEETTSQETAELQDPDRLAELNLVDNKILRFAKLRDALIAQDQQWAIEHTKKRQDLLEEAGLLEQFKELDLELSEHRKQFKANVEPVISSVKVLHAYRLSQLEGKGFPNMETLAKVWAFEEQIWGSLEKAKEEEAELDVDAETEDHPEEKSEENSEE